MSPRLAVKQMNRLLCHRPSVTMPFLTNGALVLALLFLIFCEVSVHTLCLYTFTYKLKNSNFLSKDIELLESVQKFASKVCTKQWREPYNSLRTSLKLPLLKERRVVLKLSVLYKYLNGLAVMPPILLLPSPTRGGTCVLPTIFICISHLHTRTVTCILVFLIPYHCGTICPCLCIIVFPFPLLTH